MKRGRPTSAKQPEGPEQLAQRNKYNQGNYGYGVMYNEKTKTYVQNDRREANPRLHSCWVQLHIIPTTFICHSLKTRLVRAFLVVMSHLFRGKRFVRVKVRLDFRCPLLPGVQHIFQWGEIWINFKYENLRSLCYRCSMVGHQIEGCCMEMRDYEDIELPHETSNGH
ncbi:hypothetical protein Tsubulata_042556 [Turnera subulata]|uniref:Zinc knuckle CX2CX4HX4C domain-containing protein n=1 Tax=Turnera subulata TaxID=218843 RepID=A0A9Q0GE43_9ROSI|nr:hypothetical protein Tsubulata_042556 [Turnera subulata]